MDAGSERKTNKEQIHINKLCMGLFWDFLGILFMCSFSPVRNGPKNTYTDLCHAPSPGTIPLDLFMFMCCFFPCGCPGPGDGENHFFYLWPIWVSGQQCWDICGDIRPNEFISMFSSFLDTPPFPNSPADSPLQTSRLPLQQVDLESLVLSSCRPGQLRASFQT